MRAGSVFFDTNFHFHDGESGEKLFIVLGSDKGITIVAKTTSQPHGKNISYGCQPADRYHNFYLPVNSCFFSKPTWVCLNEFYELNDSTLLQKRFSGVINHVCDIDDRIAKEIQLCAISSEDITLQQETIIQLCLLP